MRVLALGVGVVVNSCRGYISDGLVWKPFYSLRTGIGWGRQTFAMPRHSVASLWASGVAAGAHPPCAC